MAGAAPRRHAARARAALLSRASQGVLLGKHRLGSRPNFHAHVRAAAHAPVSVGALLSHARRGTRRFIMTMAMHNTAFLDRNVLYPFAILAVLTGGM